MKYTLSTLLMMFMIGCSADPGVRASDDVSEEAAPKIVDHLSALSSFLAAVERAEGAAEKRAAYRAHFVAQDPPLYDAFVGDLEDFSYDYLSRAMKRILEVQDGIREYRALALRQIPEALRAASATYGALFEDVPQHLTLNLFRSNAQIRIHDGQVTILYGIDTWAGFEDVLLPTTPRDLRVTVAHELFHAFHWDANPFMAEMAPRFLPPRSDAPLWINLWSEGLATCASRHVYPESDIALVLALEGIWEEAEWRLPELAAELRPLLGETDEAITSRWLFLQLPERADGLPNKAGYIIATVAAHHIVVERGLMAAARLAGDELWTAIDDAFRMISAGDGAVIADELCVPEDRSPTVPATGATVDQLSGATRL